MDHREDLNTILPFLPLVLRSSSLFWPSQVVEALKALSQGPHHSKVDSGEVLFLAVSDIRQSLNLAGDVLAFSTGDGVSLFFDDREDLNTILPFLPLVLRSSSLFWPSQVVEALKALSKGPHHSKVDSGEVLFLAVSDIRQSLNLAGDVLAFSTGDGFSLFFDDREDLNTILPFLPLLLRSSSLFWPSQVVEALKALSKGPHHSKVDSGEILFLAVSDIRQSLNLVGDVLAFSAGDGFSLFFDDLMSRAEANKWFGDVLPAMADLLLRLPSMLEAHYNCADSVTCVGGRNGLKTGLRLLKSQEAGIVLLSQELIGTLLACSFFCLFPINSRDDSHLQVINFDHLFASLYDNYNEKQENKIKCIIHYFERICSNMPVGNVSFERKVLAVDQTSNYIPYPEAESWSKSVVSLSLFEVCSSGLIEDQSKEALEVDFANKYFGGGALSRGCVQEEIRFMINPELIAGMLFLPCMADNEAIEVVGAERFSNYTGYASSFRFCGDFLDKKDSDIMGRRKTRIIAIDALVHPGTRQFRHEFLLREVNKAFCGFSDPCKSQRYRILLKDHHLSEAELDQKLKSLESNSDNALSASFEDEVGIVTGNWGCGAFGGDPELKAMLQWLAASQALRPFVIYYTFGLEALQTLDQVTKWITSNGWSVGDLWNMIVEYSSQRKKKETAVGFFNWLLPLLTSDDPMILDP